MSAKLTQGIPPSDLPPTYPRGIVGPELWKSGVILAATYVFILTWFLLSQRAVDFCSKDYFAVLLIFLVVSTIAIGKLYVRAWMNYVSLAPLNPHIDPYDFKYTSVTCYELAKGFINHGLHIGFFRVDGGIGTYTILAANNIRPQVMVATCGFMMLMYSSILVTTSATQGLIKFDYGIWLFGIGFIGGVIGYGAILLYWRRTQRLSTAYTLVGVNVVIAVASSLVSDTFIFVKAGMDGTFQGNFVDPCSI